MADGGAFGQCLNGNCDRVFGQPIGGEAFGLRAKAKNFSMEEMKEGIEFAHAHDVKVYVTANILARNDDLEGVHVQW